MAKTSRLSKISIRSINVKQDTEYADTQALTEALITLASKYHIPLGKYVSDLVHGRVDCITLTKDKPYFYYYARRHEGNISMSVKELDRIIEFTIPTSEAEKLTVLNQIHD